MTEGSAYWIYYNQQILTLLYKWNNVIPSVSDDYATKQAVMLHSKCIGPLEVQQFSARRQEFLNHGKVGEFDGSWA